MANARVYNLAETYLFPELEVLFELVVFYAYGYRTILWVFMGNFMDILPVYG